MMRRMVALLGVAAAGCAGAGDKAATPETAVPVQTATVVRDTLAEVLDLVGRLVPTPGSSARLTAPVAAIVGAVSVQVGMEVDRGQELMTLDAPDLRERVAAARAAASAAEQEEARASRLVQDGVAARRTLEEARARLASAVAEQRTAEDLFARTRVRSPLEGAVQQVAVEPGERVDAGQVLAVIVDADTVDLVAAVPADDLGGLRRGQRARVLVDGDPGARAGTVVGISPAVDSLTGAAQVLVRIPNPKEILHPGAGATAEIVVRVHRGALVIPESALVRDGDSLAVFVVGHDSRVVKRRVQTVASQGGRVAVEGGLAPGDRLVTIGVLGLQEGMRVVPDSTAHP